MDPLPNELVEQILLRIPPSDPATLARAAVARKQWCRLVASPGFRSRYRDLHRVAPMLGFLCDPRNGDGFVPASSFRPKPRADRRQLRLEDARHGRVLLRAYKQPAVGPYELPVRDWFCLVFWDPITGHQVDLPRPKGFFPDEGDWKATVLCAAASPAAAAAAAGSCNHLDCHSGHFIVVLIGNYSSGMLSCVYSSQDGEWSKIIFARHLNAYLGVDSDRSAHVGNALYCMLSTGNKILKYDLGTREFSVIEPPPLLSLDNFTCSDEIQLTTMKDGQLGLSVLRQSTLYVLSTEEDFAWRGIKIIDLEKCGNYVPSTTTPFLIGFAGDAGLVFMNFGKNRILSVDLRSSEVKVVYQKGCISRIVPYISFCTPAIPAAMGVLSKDDKPRAAASRDVQSCVASSLLSQGK